MPYHDPFATISPAMARSQSLAPLHDSSNITTINLSRLLSRIDAKLSQPTTVLSASSLERAKISMNLEYARQLLQQLEKDSGHIKSNAERQKRLTDLGTQKQTIRRLNESLHLAAQIEEISDEEDEVEEDVLPMKENGTENPAEAPETVLSVDTGVREMDEKSYPYSPATTTSILRNRFSSHKEQREVLFKKSGDDESVDTERILDIQRKQQEDLSEGLLKMASMLKESSIQFGVKLENEKAYLDQAHEGLDKNVQGMESAGGKLERLRKNDSVGWYWTIIYIAIILVLIFFTMFVLFVMPKFRWW